MPTLMILVLAVLTTATASAQTLNAIQATKRFACGVVQEADDYDRADNHGDLSALDADVCRAVCVAILGDTGGLDIRAYPSEDTALKSLHAGLVQLLVGATPTATASAQYAIEFGPPVFYDTQRVLVPRQSGITTLEGLRDLLVCEANLTEPEQTLTDEMASRKIPYAHMAHSEQGEMDAAIAVRRCEAGTGLESRLAQSQSNFHALTSDFVFLPDRFGLEPVAPAYRYGDPTFGLVVGWTVHALVEAEALGITQANVAQARARTDMRAQRLLGGDFATAQALGLSHDWAARVIAATGNYGEIFDRAVGKPWHLERGPNALWTEGGLMRPLPMR